MEGQTPQWLKEEGQTPQWLKEEGLTPQWLKEEGQTPQWLKEEGQTPQKFQFSTSQYCVDIMAFISDFSEIDSCFPLTYGRFLYDYVCITAKRRRTDTTMAKRKKD
jgi:hypothetical protein